MRTDLNSLKKEISRLTDIKYLKKEVNRIAGEVKKFDVQSRLTPRAKARLEKFETRFRDAIVTLKDLQRQVDANLDRFVDIVRARSQALRTARTTKSAGAKSRTSSRGAKASRKTARKAAPKTSSKRAKKSK